VLNTVNSTPEAKARRAAETATKSVSMQLTALSASRIPNTAPTGAPTGTPSITQTPTQLVTPIQILEGDFNVTLYTVSDANARACPALQCDIVATFPSGMPVPITASVAGEEITPNVDVWYRTAVNGTDVYIYADLVSRATPIPASANNGVQIVATQSNVQSAPQVDGSGCAGFDRSVCSQYSEPANCTDAVNMGIPSHIAACCFTKLDRDNPKDGEACYGN
jgi:hypothetical protein